MMSELKNQTIHLIEHNAARKVSVLSGEYVRAKSRQKEALHAAMEIERWLGQSCQDSLQD